MFCINKKRLIFVKEITTKKNNIMKVVSSPTIENTKKIMSNLLECVKDKSISTKERNQYYKEYTSLAANLLILLR
jgi:hypothetical protein